MLTSVKHDLPISSRNAPYHQISYTYNQFWNGKHRFEHRYVDNQIYFITARCRERYPAFSTQAARDVFWDRFNHWTRFYAFVPWITIFMWNHYHTIGYLKEGAQLGQMMRRIHGSVAKLVNDVLPERRRPFWRDMGGMDYFDGCLRDELQCRRAYRYTMFQCHRHGICNDPKDFADTRVSIELERGLGRARELRAFLYDVPYARYLREKRSRGREDMRH